MQHPWTKLRKWLRNGWNVIHAGVTGVALWWAAQLLTPPPTFETSISYNAFADIAPEPYWAVACGVLGMLGVVVIIWRLPTLTLVAAFFLSILHCVVAAMMVVSNKATTGTGTYLIIAAMAFGLFMERLYEQREAKLWSEHQDVGG